MGIFQSAASFRDFQRPEFALRHFIRFILAKVAVGNCMEIMTAIEGLGLLESIPLWLVSLLGSLFITVMSFILLLTVYGRFFRLYMFTALAPLPSFAGEGTAASGKAFLKSYIGVCMEGR